MGVEGRIKGQIIYHHRWGGGGSRTQRGVGSLSITVHATSEVRVPGINIKVFILFDNTLI